MHGLLTNTRAIASTEASLDAPAITKTPRRVGMFPSSSLACSSTPLFELHRPSLRITVDPAWLIASHSPGTLEYVPAPHAMQLAEPGAPAAEYDVDGCIVDTCSRLLAAIAGYSSF